jgi:hypothetical protein
VTSGGKPRERDLIGGVLLVLSVFFVAAFGTARLLVFSGWNPLEGSGYAYGAAAIAFIVGAFAVYACNLFQLWHSFRQQSWRSHPQL